MILQAFGVLFLFLMALALIRFYPDLRRYLQMKSM
jgi:hypothetical protein